MAPVRGQRQSPWRISTTPMLPFFHHPLPLSIQLACSKTLPSVTFLWQTERQKEQKDLSRSPFSFPLVSACFLLLWPPWPSQQTWPIPSLLPPKQTPQFCFPKTFHWQFLPSSFQHSLCVTVSSLPSHMAGRRVPFLLTLSLVNPRHPSPKPMAYNTLPWLVPTNASLHAKTNLLRKVVSVALLHLLLTRQALCCNLDTSMSSIHHLVYSPPVLS